MTDYPEPPTLPRNPPQTKGERTASRILDAAERLFAEKGYEGTSLREIATVVGIREPGLYRHFAGKAAIYHAVLERALGPLVALLEDVLASGLAPEKMQALPGQVLDRLAEHPHVACLFQQAVMASPGQQTEANRWLETLLASGHQLLAAQVQRNPASTENPQERVIRLMALFNLCVGYFSAGNILQTLAGRSPDDADMLVLQKRLLNEVAALWLSANS